MRYTPLTITIYGYAPSIIKISKLVDDLQTLWRMFCIVSSIPHA
jgi:hypothetical protein